MIQAQPTRPAVVNPFLSNVIDAAIADTAMPGDAMSVIAKSLRLLASNGLKESLLALMDCPDCLDNIAARSYRHGNGFWKLVLSQSSTHKLRLHIWFPGTDAEENAHDHRWHFASTIVDGTLTSEIWQEAASPDAVAFDELLYFAKDGDLAPVIVPNGKTKLICTKTVVRSAGEAYTMAPGTIHRIVRCGQKLTATLMCQAAPARRWNRLIPKLGQAPDVEQRYLTRPELTAAIVRYLALTRAQ